MSGMKKTAPFCPHWQWWIRSGERLQLGIDLREVFAPAATEIRNKALQSGLEEVGRRLRAGGRVVDSLKESGMRLPMEAWCLLESGEHTGKLGEAMQQVGEFLEQGRLRRREVLGRIWYPALVFLTGSVVMGIILFWVVPRMRETSVSMGLGHDLPWLTENIGTVFAGLFAAGLCSVVFTTTAALVVRRMGRRSLRWAGGGEWIRQRIPVVGRAMSCAREARILQQLATLLEGGTTLPRALEMSAEAGPDQWERHHLERFRQHLLLGAGFPEAMRSCPLLSPESVHLLLAGQESGRLEEYMVRVAQDLRRQSDWRFRQATAFMEPAFLIVLSAAIGSLILAYILPMVRMLEQAGGTL